MSHRVRGTPIDRDGLYRLVTKLKWLRLSPDLTVDWSIRNHHYLSYVSSRASWDRVRIEDQIKREKCIFSKYFFNFLSNRGWLEEGSVCSGSTGCVFGGSTFTSPIDTTTANGKEYTGVSCVRSGPRRRNLRELPSSREIRSHQLHSPHHWQQIELGRLLNRNTVYIILQIPYKSGGDT